MMRSASTREILIAYHPLRTYGGAKALRVGFEPTTNAVETHSSSTELTEQEVSRARFELATFGLGNRNSSTELPGQDGGTE